MLEVGTEKAYSTQELARLLDTSAATVRLYMKQGKLKYQRVGRRFYATETNVKIFLRGGDNGSI